MKPSVVLSLLTDTQEYQRLQADDARATAERLGIELQVLFAENNLVRHIHQLLGCINVPKSERPSAIITESLTVDGLEGAARSAVQAGLGWIQLSSRPKYMDALRREFPTLPIATVSVDNEKIGEIQADQYAALLPEGGNVLYIQGPPRSASTLGRRTGTERRLQNTKLKIVKSLTADWTEEGGERVVASWLDRLFDESARPDLVGCQNDTMAVGARKAFITHRPRWTGIPFTGCDGLVEGGQKLVKEGILLATVLKPSLAGAALELVLRALGGQAIPPDLTIAVHSCPPVGELARWTVAKARS